MYSDYKFYINLIIITIVIIIIIITIIIITIIISSSISFILIRRIFFKSYL